MKTIIALSTVFFALLAPVSGQGGATSLLRFADDNRIICIGTNWNLNDLSGSLVLSNRLLASPTLTIDNAINTVMMHSGLWVIGTLTAPSITSDGFTSEVGGAFTFSGTPRIIGHNIYATFAGPMWAVASNSVNSTTSAEVLQSRDIPAYYSADENEPSFDSTGIGFRFRFSGNFAATPLSAKRLLVKFGNATLLDTGSRTNINGGAYVITGEIISRSNTNQFFNVTYAGAGATNFVTAGAGRTTEDMITALTLSLSSVAATAGDVTNLTYTLDYHLPPPTQP